MSGSLRTSSSSESVSSSLDYKHWRSGIPSSSSLPPSDLKSEFGRHSRRAPAALHTLSCNNTFNEQWHLEPLTF
eukprot:g50275.t1